MTPKSFVSVLSMVVLCTMPLYFRFQGSIDFHAVQYNATSAVAECWPQDESIVVHIDLVEILYRHTVVCFC